MTQPQHSSNLLGRATPAVNPRYQADLDAVAAHDKGIEENADPKPNQVEPNHNWEKRYKDLQSHNSRKINELTQQLQEAQSQPVQPLVVPKTAEELAALRKQDPDGYARIESIAAAMVKSQLGAYDQKLAEVTGDLNQTRIANAEAELLKAHPDFKEITADPSFHQWAEAQSTDIQDWIYNNPDKPELASRALTLYKATVGGMGNQTQTTATNQPSGDIDVGVRTPSQTPEAVDRNHPSYIWKESEIARMRPAEFGQWVEAITLAQNEGRVAIGQ